MDTNLRQLEDEILPVLVQQFPRAFFARGKSCRPLRVGIFDEIDAALPPEIDRKRLRAYLGYYAKLNRYLRELTPGATRIDLNGAPAGTVTEQEAKQAAYHLECRLKPYVRPEPAAEPAKVPAASTAHIQAVVAALTAPIEAEPEAAPAEAVKEPLKVQKANLAELLAAAKYVRDKDYVDPGEDGQHEEDDDGGDAEIIPYASCDEANAPSAARLRLVAEAQKDSDFHASGLGAA